MTAFEWTGCLVALALVAEPPRRPAAVSKKSNHSTQPRK